MAEGSTGWLGLDAMEPGPTGERCIRPLASQPARHRMMTAAAAQVQVGTAGHETRRTGENGIADSGLSLGSDAAARRCMADRMASSCERIARQASQVRTCSASAACCVADNSPSSSA